MPRTRGNGGIIGPRQSTTQGSANGVWYNSDAAYLQGAGFWPGLVIPVSYLAVGGGGGAGGY